MFKDLFKNPTRMTAILLIVVVAFVVDQYMNQNAFGLIKKGE